MHVRTVKIFDDYVRVSADPTFTSDEWSAELARGDAVAIQAVIEGATPSGSSGTFDLFVLHSADNRNWWVRWWGVPGSTYTTYLGDISVGVVLPGLQYSRMYCDGSMQISGTGTGPLLPYVRLSMSMTSVSTGGAPAFLGATVKIYATFRGRKRW